MPTAEYRVAIFDRRQGESSKIDPLWLEHDGSALMSLDSRLRGHEVGAIAAFASSAFVSGRWICLYLDFEPDDAHKVHRSIRRWGRIE
jgi:hypothetical protein